MNIVHHEGVSLLLPKIELIQAHEGATTPIMSPIVRVVRRSRSCRGMVSDHEMGHGCPSSYGSTWRWSILSPEGVGLALPIFELILGTRGCYDYHHEPYR